MVATTLPLQPRLVILAGPNGAGKSSAAPQLLRGASSVEAFVNADVIAQGLAGMRSDEAAIKAGRLMIEQLRDLASRRLDFAFETTLSGLTIRRQLPDFVELGYTVQLLYLWLPSADQAIARVRMRVVSGGHDVPEDVVRRRYGRSLANFWSIYRPLATTWRLYDASAPNLRPVIAYGRHDTQMTVIDATRWDVVRRQLDTTELLRGGQE